MENMKYKYAIELLEINIEGNKIVIDELEQSGHGEKLYKIKEQMEDFESALELLREFCKRETYIDRYVCESSPERLKYELLQHRVRAIDDGGCPSEFQREDSYGDCGSDAVRCVDCWSQKIGGDVDGEQ